VRLFFALWPPAATAQALAAWGREVQESAGGQVTETDSIHLTLAFLGESEPMKASAAAERVTTRRFALPVDAAKYWKHNKIVWVGPQTMPAQLARLVGQLHPALREAGFVLEERPFAAHVTLIRKAGVPAAIPALPKVAWPVDEFVLVKSVPTGKGLRYETVQRFALA
jgi:RNA 2',3'-cyclic 3'-phosphodiesterase